MKFSAVRYLYILVVFSKVQEAMVGSDGFSKFPNVDAHSNEVLPDLPVFEITLKGLLQGMKGFVSINEGDRNTKTKRTS